MTGDRELKAMESTLAALQPLDADERQRVLGWLAAKLGVRPPGSAARQGGGPSPVHAGDLSNIKEFLKQKAPTDDVARATTLAYFLGHSDNLTTYKLERLSQARADAALAKLNMSRAVANAKRAGYLTTGAEHGSYQITTLGESLVDAMPDAEALKIVRAQGTKRRRKSTSAKSASKQTTPKTE